MQGSWDRRRWTEAPSCIHSLWVAGGGGGLVAKSFLTLATPWTVACHAPLSMRFSRQEYWSELPFSSSGDLPDPGVEPRSPALQADSFPSELQWVAGGLINGQVHPQRAGGRQRARAPLGGVGGNGRSRLPPSFCVLGQCSLALGQRDQCVQTEGVRKDPTEPAPLDTKWVCRLAGKAEGGRRQGSLFV